jgi:hypothetical protein
MQSTRKHAMTYGAQPVVRESLGCCFSCVAGFQYCFEEHFVTMADGRMDTSLGSIPPHSSAPTAASVCVHGFAYVCVFVWGVYTLVGLFFFLVVMGVELKSSQ